VIIQGAYPVGGGPVATPTAPPAHLGLFTLPIHAGQSAGNGGFNPAEVVDVRRQVTALGGIIPVKSVQERDSITPYNGLVVMRLDKGGSLDRYVQGAWHGNSDWVDVPMNPGWRPTVAGVGVQLRARVIADGLLGEVLGELILDEPFGLPVEGWSFGTLPPYIKPAEGSFILGTSNNYQKAQVFYIRQNGDVAIGPNPQGRVMQFHGIFPLQQA
jgi:hypothetical protein